MRGVGKREFDRTESSAVEGGRARAGRVKNQEMRDRERMLVRKRGSPFLVPNLAQQEQRPHSFERNGYRDFFFFF